MSDFLIRSPEDYNEDYNTNLLTQAAFLESFMIHIEILNIQTNTLTEYNTGIYSRVAIDPKHYNRNMCLCNDSMIAIEYHSMGFIHLFNFQTQERTKLNLVNRGGKLRYCPNSNTLQTYYLNSVDFYCLDELRPLANLRIFNNGKYIYTSYVDKRYFSTNYVEDTVQILNQIRNSTLSRKDIEEYAANFNCWKYFDELLFKKEKSSHPEQNRSTGLQSLLPPPE